MNSSIYDRLRLLPAARLARSTILRFEPTAYRVGGVVGTPGFRPVARARVAASRRDWAQAATEWRQALGSGRRTHPSWHYEYARVLDNLWRSGDADGERQKALEHGSRNPFEFRRLAGRAANDEAWSIASMAYERAAALDPSSDSLERAADAALEGGDLERASVLYHRVIAEADDATPGPYAGLGTTLRRAGRLSEAETVLTAARPSFPTSAALAAAHAWVATERHDWAAAAHRWPLAFANRRRQIPPRWIFRYGEALELLGRHRDAAEVYDLALVRLAAIEEPWAHWALLEWEYRRARCRHLCGDEPDAEPRLSVAVRPVHVAGDRPSARTGHVVVDVNHLGLRIHGQVDDTSVPTVDVKLDDVAIKSVDVDRSAPTLPFTFTLRHEALDALPPRCRVSVETSNGELLTDFDDHQQVEVLVPHGDGSVFQRLEGGDVFTKKGALVSAEHAEISAEDLLAAYTQVREFFEVRLGAPLFLLYGTLLGCHRDGRFIPGDDDLDVGYVTTCSDPASAKEEGLRVVRLLLDAGFDVSTRHGGNLFKIWIGMVDIDVYPIWFHQGRAWGYDAIDATRDDYEPVTEEDLLGTKVLVPNRPEHLLRATYGPEWRVPQPGFRHYRHRSILNVLKRSALTPSEAREMMAENEALRASNPTVGQFTMHNSGTR